MLALDLFDEPCVAALKQIIGDRAALFLPVIAEETAGFNAIPDAMAQVLGRELQRLVVAGEIVQINKVGHTRAKAFQRLVTPPRSTARSNTAPTTSSSTIMSVWGGHLRICAAFSNRAARG